MIAAETSDGRDDRPETKTERWLRASGLTEDASKMGILPGQIAARIARQNATLRARRHGLTPAEVSTNSPEIVERLRGGR